jgi:predicted nucleic acid-binding Zn ribbon protein
MAPQRTFDCPVCGEAVPIKAKACPSCGACEKSGWNEESEATDGLDLPEDDFDYEKFTADEFGQPKKRRGKELLWWITALILLIIIGVTTGYNMLFN